MKHQPFGDCIGGWKMHEATALRDCIGGWKVHEAPALWGLYRRLDCPEAALEAAWR